MAECARLGPTSQVLHSVDSGLTIALDTGSEASIGQIGLLENVRLVLEPVCVEGIGGMRVFDKIGDLLLAGNHRITVFAGEKGDLPPDFHVLLGTAHLLELGASLDFALSHPGYPLTDAMAFGRSRVVSTPLPTPSRRFREAAGAASSGSGAIMVALLFAVTAIWFDVRSTLLVQDASEPRALAGAMIAGSLALWFWLLLGAIGPSLVSLLSPAQFAPWLSFRRR